MNVYVCFSLVLLGVVLAAGEQYIDGEFFLGLEKDVDAIAFYERIERDLDISLIDSWELETTLLALVAGEEDDVLRASQLPGVKYWDRNALVFLQQCAELPNPGTWGLDRIDQTDILPYNNTEREDATYTWGEDDGAGVTVYVIDTGIQTNHTEFNGRATWGFNATGLGDEDGNGHGTHCAGTIGSDAYGVAKAVNLVAVKVMSDRGFGTTGDIVAGLNWVAGQHVPGDRDIVSMSIGGTGNNPMDDATNSLINAGIAAVIAAGNSNENACDYSPARVANATTVGASNIDDESAVFSNFGTCVDITAPGVLIKSTWQGEDANSTLTISGTSMACPHVAGAAARYASSLPSAPTPAQINDYLVATGTPDVLTLQPTHEETPNLLLYVGCPM